MTQEWRKYPCYYQRIRVTAWHDSRKNAFTISIESLLNDGGSQGCLLSIRESKVHSMRRIGTLEESNGLFFSTTFAILENE